MKSLDVMAPTYSFLALNPRQGRKDAAVHAHKVTSSLHYTLWHPEQEHIRLPLLFSFKAAGQATGTS